MRKILEHKPIPDNVLCTCGGSFFACYQKLVEFVEAAGKLERMAVQLRQAQGSRFQDKCIALLLDALADYERLKG